ncbi:sulfatase [Candidatus Latescibacterota bacterium]
MDTNQISRRDFIQTMSAGVASCALATDRVESSLRERKAVSRRPNLVYILTDQWRAQATGYADDPNAHTPHLDALAGESVNFTNAVSCCPICSPYRACLMTGRYPLTTGVFVNDVYLDNDAVSIAQAYNGAGYDTGYIGKWHLDAHGRSSFIPRERRQGFEFWKALECSHAYNDSYYFGDENVKLKWEGYDAFAQTVEAQNYIKAHTDGAPFSIFLSLGPPHDPYQTAPERYRKRYDSESIVLRPNVPEEHRGKARTDLAGYYAHIAALDDCVGELIRTLEECGIADDTILVFTSDHGDMLGSQGYYRKQKPWDESIKVPFLLRYPALLGSEGKVIDMPINSPDIMPTLLGLSGVDVPSTVEGFDLSGEILGEKELWDYAALLMVPWTFHKYRLAEFRGIRTARYTYVARQEGPWVMFDNETDPFQLDNLCRKPEHGKLLELLDDILQRRLKETNDEFLPGIEYIRKWGYKTDESGAVPYEGDTTKY